MLRLTAIFILACLSSLDAKGLTKAPTLIRACLNISDSVVTIDYSSISDACGSFVEHHIYGSENGVTFNLLDSQKNFSATTFQFKLPNANPTWSFFFESRYLCNGSDTAKSNVLKLDITPPPENDIDSVSIDILTQKTIIGWKKSTANDTKGYRIFTQSNGINSPIGDTIDLAYVAKNQTVTLETKYTMAVYDSCDLFSSISKRHSPMVLSTTLDTCTKSASLTWTKYEGWVVESQKVYISTNGSPFVPKTINANDQSNSYTGINFGDSVCFYVCAENNVSNRKTSSSNVKCVKLYQPKIPDITYLSNVSVASKSSLEIEAFVDNQGVADSLVLYRVGGSPIRVGSKTLLKGAEFYTWEDNNVNPETGSSTYFVRTFAPCLGGTSSSLNASSIFLNITNESLTWNPYINWNGSVLEYEVYGYNGSTWNIVATTSATDYTNTDTTMHCFYIQAVENQNTYGFGRVSKSNTVCAKRTPKFFVPNTLNPLSKNNKLVVIGNSIDPTNSTMVVFNRWGEQIFTTNNIQEGWSVDATNTLIPLGVYFYDIAIMDLNGNKHRLSGSVRVIR
ncbi:MAG: gliding motility-associated C-terminal domain-containing protein [Bacteroidetes bacterium]|nr:gliding motility-associated C-terminal domain-containing protein [Bacteroidota bacterium]